MCSEMCEIRLRRSLCSQGSHKPAAAEAGGNRRRNLQRGASWQEIAPFSDPGFFCLFHCLKNQVSKRSMSHSRSFLCKYESVDLIFAKQVLTGPSLAQCSTAALSTTWPSSISNAAQLEKSSYFGSVKTMLSRITFIDC